jgi:hypothetical protein
MAASIKGSLNTFDLPCFWIMPSSICNSDVNGELVAVFLDEIAVIAWRRLSRPLTLSKKNTLPVDPRRADPLRVKLPRP